jgi:nitrite reductase/ring-hydroxylating ferredoxin subunit
MKVSRRGFLKQYLFLPATAMALGQSTPLRLLGEVQETGPGGVLYLRISDYPALTLPLGSLRIGLHPVDGTDLGGRPYYPILINHLGAGVYYVLKSRCTHEGCVLPTYNLAQMEMFCSCHSSRFHFDGSVKAGPASRPLDAYEFSVSDGVMQIQVPEMPLSLSALHAVSVGGQQRFRIEFKSEPDVEYEVVRRTRLEEAEAWTAVPFSPTPSGAATQTRFTGSGSRVSLYFPLENTSGFYHLRMVVQEV